MLFVATRLCPRPLLLALALPAFAQDPRDTAFLTAREAFRAGD